MRVLRGARCVNSERRNQRGAPGCRCLKLSRSRMKIAILLICGFALRGWLCCAQEEFDPFAEPTVPLPKPEIPDRGVLKLPESVTYECLDSGKHEYRIAGLYSLEEDSDPDGSASYYARSFEYVLEEGAEAEVELVNGCLVIRVSEQIPYDSLAFAIDGVASGGGEVPTWVELEARDLKRSELYDRNHYHVVKLNDEFPRGLAWLSMSRSEELRLPFTTKFWSKGTLLVSPTTARCMCHSRFAIRILHEDGYIIWEEADPAHGAVQVAMADIDSDRIHELYFETNDHGKRARYVVKPERKQEGADQSTGAPESKTEGDSEPQPNRRAPSR